MTSPTYLVSPLVPVLVYRYETEVPLVKYICFWLAIGLLGPIALLGCPPENDDDVGDDHPVVADPGGDNMPFVVEGYPTYPVLDRDMTIANPDLWPFNCSAVGALL